MGGSASGEEEEGAVELWLSVGGALEKATAVSAAAVSSAAGTEGDRLRRVREPSGLGTRPRDL